MYCNESIHFGLIDLNHIECPFCDEKIQNFNPIKYTCCDNMNIIKDDLWSKYNKYKFLICEQCGSVHGYGLASEYIDFYENRHIFHRKSIYNRKYHLQNKIWDLTQMYNADISYKQNQQILDIFTKIDKVLPIVNNGLRKRMIKIDFILNKLFDKLKIPVKIPQNDSKKLSLYNEQYWNKINSLIGKEIQSILVR